MREAYVGIDVGTTLTKAGIWSAGRWACATRRNELRVASDGAAEQNPEQLWRAAIEAVRQVLNEAGRVQIRGICLTGHSPSLVSVGGGHSLGPVITWLDSRPLQADMDPLRPTGPSFEATAHWLAATLSGTSEWRLLQPKDLIVWRLTSEMCTDTSSLSCCLEPGHWPGCPAAVAPWDVCGAVTAEAAHATGLPQGTPVFSGGIDAFVEALGAGLTLPGTICDSTGTSTCLTEVLPPDARGGVQHVLPDRLLNVVPSGLSGGALEWTLSLLQEDHSGDWEALIRDSVLHSRPGADAMLFRPHLKGKRGIAPDGGARGAFIGLRMGHGRSAMIRAALEGCACMVRESLESMAGSASEVRAVGSGARHDDWLQIKADLTGRAYIKMTVLEGALLGAAILAAWGSGDFASAGEAVAQIVSERRAFEPRTEYRALYGALYDAYRRAGGALSEVEGVLATIR